MTNKPELDRSDWIAGLEKGIRIIEAFNDAHPRLTPSTAFADISSFCATTESPIAMSGWFRAGFSSNTAEKP